MIGAFISFLNNTLLNIALPSIMKELEIGTSTAQWLTTGFMLVNGILIPTTAFLIQKYSVRNLFLAAMGLFTLGTILAGSANIFAILLLGRMLQAAGSAILMPLLMNVMLVSFPIQKRGTAMGVFGLILMFAPAIGPTLSGWIIEHYNWRMLFHFITPIAVIVFLIGFFLLKDKKEKVDIRLDFVSLLLSSIGFGGLLYGFSSAGEKGWDSPYVYGPIIIGAISLIWFVLVKPRKMSRFLILRSTSIQCLLYHPSFRWPSIWRLFAGMILLPIYIQNIRGISPMDAGLLMLPGALLMAGMSPLTGKLFDKYGGRILAIIGLAIMVVTTYEFSRLQLDTTYSHLLMLYSVRMVGMSMVMMPVSTNGLNQLPRYLYPHGTAMNNTLNQVAGAIGTALLVTIMSNRTETHATEIANEAMKNVVGTPTGAALEEMKQQIAMKAMLEGINDAFLVATGITVVALILAFFIKRATPAKDSFEGKKSGKKWPRN